MADEQPVFEVGKAIWPIASTVGGNASEETQKEIRQLVTEFAEYVANALEKNGIARFASPIFRPFNALFAATREKIFVIISPLTGGLANLRFFDWKDAPETNLDQAIQATHQQLGWTDVFAFQLPTDHIHIQIGHCLFQRKIRVVRIITGTQHPIFFPCP